MLNNNELSDIYLISRLAKDDEDAFASLYNRHFTAINSFILRYVKSDQLSEDLAQEVFIKIWENRKRLGHVENFKAYLTVSARNYTLNSLRNIAKSEAALGTIIKAYVSTGITPEDHLTHKDYQAFLDKILNSLTPQTRKIFRECRENGRKYDEVAAELGISRNAVKKHMVFAMKVLRNSVEHEFGLSLSVMLYLLFKR